MIKALNEVVTPFVDDLAATQAFYTDVFGLEAVYQSDASTVLRLGPMMINLLRREQAPGLVEPAEVAGSGSGVRALFTIKVNAGASQRGDRPLHDPRSGRRARRATRITLPEFASRSVSQDSDCPGSQDLMRARSSDLRGTRSAEPSAWRSAPASVPAQ